MKREPWEREFQEVWRKEQWFLRRYDEKTENALERCAAEVAPEKLLGTLHGAFAKTFQVVFEHGSGLIRRAGRQEARRTAYQARAEAVCAQESRETLKAFSRAAGRSGLGNIVASGAAGVGLGLFGITLPDIPLFTAMLLKSVYDTAESYGFPCDTAEEQLYVLRIVETALSYGEALRAGSRELDGYAQTGRWSAPVRREQLIQAAARRLSEAVLYGKALQNVPVAGAVGGAGNAVCLSRVQRFADIKYHKRFLIRRRLET